MNSTSWKRSYLSRLQIGFLSEFAKSHSVQCLHYVNENGFPTGNKCTLYSVRPEIYRKAIFLHSQATATPPPHTHQKMSFHVFHSVTFLLTNVYSFSFMVYSRIVTFNGQVRLITGECTFLMDIAASTAFSA